MPPPRGSWNPLEGAGDYDVTSQVHEDTYPAIDSAKINLHGKAVFIAGGSKGIGKEIVLSFARAGASFIASGSRSDCSFLADDIKLAAKDGEKSEPNFLPLTLDTTSQQSVDDAAEKIMDAFGRIDIVVNVAGIIGQRGVKVADSDPEQWWNTWNVNLRGPYLVCRAFIPLLLNSPDGLKTIVNISSVGAIVTGPGLSAYQPSKTAVVRLTDFVAKEYVEEGLVCFTIHPGNVMTDIFGPGGVPKGMEHIFVEKPRLPADTIAFLTSEKRDWISGRYINVTWDMPELMAKEEEIVKGDKLKLKLDY